MRREGPSIFWAQTGWASVKKGRRDGTRRHLTRQTNLQEFHDRAGQRSGARHHYSDSAAQHHGGLFKDDRVPDATAEAVANVLHLPRSCDGGDV
jgi:hypothetical protein